MYKIVPVLYFLDMVLSPHGLAVQHHSLPPFSGTPRSRCSCQGPQPSCVWSVNFQKRRAERPLCCAELHIYRNIFRIPHVLKHVYTLPPCDLAHSLRCLQAQLARFLFSTLCHHLSSPAFWEAGIFGLFCCCLYISQRVVNMVFLVTGGNIICTTLQENNVML